MFSLLTDTLSALPGLLIRFIEWVITFSCLYVVFDLAGRGLKLSRIAPEKRTLLLRLGAVILFFCGALMDLKGLRFGPLPIGTNPLLWLVYGLIVICAYVTIRASFRAYRERWFRGNRPGDDDFGSAGDAGIPSPLDPDEPVLVGRDAKPIPRDDF